LDLAGIAEARTPRRGKKPFGKRNGDGGGGIHLRMRRGKMRPGVRAAIQGSVRPDRMITVFAGQDREAKICAPPFHRLSAGLSVIAILRDGELVYMMERRQIEPSGLRKCAALTRHLKILRQS